MKPQLTSKARYNTAILTSVIVITSFLLCVFACVMSPVSWSPDSSKIALLVTPKPDEEEPSAFAIFTYDLKTEQRTLIEKSEGDEILSAPSWSPNGKWIAYYKTVSTNVGEDLYSEDKNYLDTFKPRIDPFLAEVDTEETFDVQLIIATPDGREHKVLKTLKSFGDDEDRFFFMHMKPVWAKNSKRIFYTRILIPDDDRGLFYIGSLDIAKGTTVAHLFNTDAMPVVSPNDKMIVSSLANIEGKTDLIVAYINGKKPKSYTLNIGERNVLTSVHVPFEWMPGSKGLLISSEEGFMLLDIGSGGIEILKDPVSEEMAYPKLSPKGDRLYYLASSEDPNDTDSIYFKSMNLQGKDAITSFELSDFPKSNNGGSLSVSPDCTLVFMRTVMKDENGNDREYLVFWNGKDRIQTETTFWLEEVFGDKYQDEDFK